MVQVRNVVTCRVNHLFWKDCCILFSFKTTKYDQNGTYGYQLWSVYSTSKSPAACPIISLSTYVLSNTGILSEKFMQCGSLRKSIRTIIY